MIEKAAKVFGVIVVFTLGLSLLALLLVGIWHIVFRLVP